MSTDRTEGEGCEHHIGSLEIQADPLYWGREGEGEGQVCK